MSDHGHRQANICFRARATSLFRIVLQHGQNMFDASPFVVVFQYAFIAAFPIVGLAVVTKWVFEDWKKSKQIQKN
jgi:hypothetical protein